MSPRWQQVGWSFLSWMYVMWTMQSFDEKQWGMFMVMGFGALSSTICALITKVDLSTDGEHE